MSGYSSTPPWPDSQHPILPASPLNPYGSASPLPPGALAPSVPGSPPPPPPRPTTQYYDDYYFSSGNSNGSQQVHGDNRYSSGGWDQQRAPNNAFPSATGEFGNLTQQQVSGSANSYRTLPRHQSTPYPSQGNTDHAQSTTLTSSASLGRHRALPLPPGSISQTLMRQPHVSAPTPRLSQRGLPALPPSASSAAYGRTPSSGYPNSEYVNTQPPAPPPRQRPLPTPTTYSYAPHHSPTPPSSSPRQTAPSSDLRDRRNDIKEVYDSPTSIRTPQTPLASYFDPANPNTGRQAGAPSRSPSNVHSLDSASTSRHSSTSRRYEQESALTSVEEDHGYPDKLAELTERDDEGTYSTIRSLSSRLNSLSAFQDTANLRTSPDAIDGRGTPTQNNWEHKPPVPSFILESGQSSRQRGVSSSTIGEGGLPGTPRALPMRTLDHKPSFIEAPSSSMDIPVEFPVPHLAVPPGGLDRATFTRHSSSESDSTGDSSGAGGNTRVSEGIDAWRRDQISQYSPTPVFQDGNTPQQVSPQRQTSNTSSLRPPSTFSYGRQSARRRRSNDLSPSWNNQHRQPSRWVQNKLLLHQSERLEAYDNDEESNISGHRRRSNQEGWDGTEDDNYDWDEMYDEDGGDEDEEEVDEKAFFQPAYLSETALRLRDEVGRGRHIKAGIAWVGSFTGKDLVSTIQSFLPSYTRDDVNDRRFALIMARSLQNQLWFVEVDWDIKPLRDSSEDVFRFMGEMEGMTSGNDGLSEELPSGLMTMATACYSPSCQRDGKCYSPRCPYKTPPSSFLDSVSLTPAPVVAVASGSGTREVIITEKTTETIDPTVDWTTTVDATILNEMSENDKTRQTLIRKAIEDEKAYEADLTSMVRLFIVPLRQAEPPLISPPHRLDQFISDVFSNSMKLRQACQNLIESFEIRQREQYPLIRTVGDIFLEAATDFRSIYPDYTGNLPAAARVLDEEMERNPAFKAFLENLNDAPGNTTFARQASGHIHLKHLITRPSTQLQRYSAALQAILEATEVTDPDRDFLEEALSSIQNLTSISQLKLFQASRGRGIAGKMEWYDLVPEEARKAMAKKEQKRQMQIWELIKGEMEYVADLETLETLFINGLREADTPIIERSRLEIFLDDAFHNYRSLLDVHSRLLEQLQARQLEQHPNVGMISDLIYDAALNWQEAYMEYGTHYPIAKAKIEEEQEKNPRFANFLETCRKNPASNKQGLDHFVNRPIPRLLRYDLILKGILESLKETGPADDPDIEQLPQILELIKDLGKAIDKGVEVNTAKVELWKFQTSLDGGKLFGRAVKDLDLLNPMRELIHKGKVFRQPEGSIGGSWTVLYVLLFDNYFVLVKHAKAKQNQEQPTKWIVNRRPIPLELLSLGDFSAPAQNRSLGLLKAIRGGGTSHETDLNGSSQPTQSDSRTVYPFTFSVIGQGILGGQYTLWTDSANARSEWKERLEHAKVLRTEVNDAGKVFEMTPLSQDTFVMAPYYSPVPSKGEETLYTGRVTCSVPFITSDGRSLVAVGCEEGVWLGIRHEPKSLRKVLHVKAVTNCAVLEEFGIFLVLSDKSLLAYHLEALVPTASSPQVRSAPQRLSGGRDVVFFSVGQLAGRTLVIYMRRKAIDSVFRVLEPILNRNSEDHNRQRSRPFGSFLGARTEWFRVYKDFFIPTEALHVHFLKAKLAIVCVKGFEIMDLTDLKGGSIPIFDPNRIKEKPAIAELARRCETAKPLGMFRSTESEFLLCYDSFGIYVDRHGEPNRDYQAIEWEGRPDSVAFHPPYLLLVSAPFIEVRHIDNAKLLQIYTGTDIRCTWDGTGGAARPFNDTPGPKGYGDETSSQEPRIHICQRPDEGKRQKGISQHVFELTPTLLLNNPLLNPVHTHDSNYFPPAPMINHRASSVTTSSSGYRDWR